MQVGYLHGTPLKKSIYSRPLFGAAALFLVINAESATIINELLRPFRAFLSPVVYFDGVFGKIVELPGFSHSDCFQVTLADGVGTTVAPVDLRVGFAGLSLEDGEEGFANGWFCFLPLISSG